MFVNAVRDAGVESFCEDQISLDSNARLVHVEYAVFCATPADVVVVMGNKMATSNSCPMLKCIQRRYRTIAR